MTASPEPEWNPAQQAVVALLGKAGAPRPAIPDDLHEELRGEIEDAIEPVGPLIPDGERLYVSKHGLTTVFQCEAHFVAGDGAFEWSPPVARGTVAHKAIELMLNVRIQLQPADLVDESIARLINSDAPIARYLGAMGEYDLGELRSLATNHVARFQECFPMPKPSWVPLTESRLAVELLDGRVRLSGKLDLTLGRAPDKVIIDLKSGWPHATHREDLRFYALLELLRLGVAPRKVASYYLDQAEAHAEDITEAALRAAARRTADGIGRIASISRGGEVPSRTPGAPCRWCPLQEDCEPGRMYLAEREADDIG